MGVEKKRTPRSVERHAANRAENETRATTNRLRLVGSPSQFGSRGERPSRTLRRMKREQGRRESAELLQRISGAYEFGGDAA